MDLEHNVKIMEPSVQQLKAGNVIFGQGHSKVDLHGAGVQRQDHGAQCTTARSR